MTVESDGGDATVATTMVDADTDAADVTDAEEALIEEGEIAGDYLEQLLDVLDFDGDIDLDVEGDRAVVSIDGGRDCRSWSAATARCSTPYRSSPASPCSRRPACAADSCLTSPAGGPSVARS